MRYSPEVLHLAEATSNAYSYDRIRSWPELVRVLLHAYKGNMDTVESIVRSKWVRWACDSLGHYPYGRVPARPVAHYIVRRLTPKDIAELVHGTQPTAFKEWEAK